LMTVLARELNAQLKNFSAVFIGSPYRICFVNVCIDRV
jgi:hypothetical protein